MQKPSAESSNFYYFCVRKLVNVCMFAYLAIATHTNVHKYMIQRYSYHYVVALLELGAVCM